MKNFYKAMQQAADADKAEVALVDAALLPDAEAGVFAPRVADVVNWAYRGKHAGVDERAWTGERHLISGIRTTEGAVRGMFTSAREQGSEREALFLATLQGQSPPQVLGTVQLTLVGDEAEIGFFSVDPDAQGQGVGGLLLSAAERHAKQKMGVAATVLWVISLRADLI